MPRTNGAVDSSTEGCSSCFPTQGNQKMRRNHLSRLIEKPADESPYYKLVFAELNDEDWLILAADDGQVAKRAVGQSAK